LEGRFRRIVALPLAPWFHDFLRPRYASLGISIFLAMYVGLKFILIVFNAADVSERWSFELTPLATLNLPDVQLAFLSGLAAVSNAFLHYSVQRTRRKWAILLTGSMVAGLLLALRAAPMDLDPVNLSRVAALVLLLALVPLDNADLLRTGREAPEDFIESELRSIARGQAEAGPVNPAMVTRALRDLEALVAGLPETTPPPAPSAASADTADDAYLRELMTSVLGESELEENLEKPAKSAVQPPKLASARDPSQPIMKDVAERSEERLRFHQGRLVRSSAELLGEARALVDEGKLEKALRRLDRVAAQDVRYPGLWELAAEAYERLGEPEIAAQCRRRAEETSL
jgi:hypothetical protein